MTAEDAVPEAGYDNCPPAASHTCGECKRVVPRCPQCGDNIGTASRPCATHNPSPADRDAPPEAPAVEAPSSGLVEQLTSLAEGAEEFKTEHGSCEVVVSPTSPIAKARIQRVAGFRVEAVEFHFRHNVTGEKTTLKDSEVYFHADDHPMFGSRATDDEFDVDYWGEDDA